MKILILGASGYLGKLLAQFLIKDGFHVYLLIRKESFYKVASLKENYPKQVHIIYYDFNKDYPQKKILIPDDIKTIIYLIGILNSKNENDYKKIHVDFLDFFLAFSFFKKERKDLIFFSSAGSIPFVSKDYYKTKLEAEKIITKNIKISWLILKPSLVYNLKGSYFSKSLPWINFIVPLFDIFDFIPFLKKLKLYKPISVDNLYKVILQRILKKESKKNIVLNTLDLYSLI